MKILSFVLALLLILGNCCCIGGNRPEYANSVPDDGAALRDTEEQVFSVDADEADVTLPGKTLSEPEKKAVSDSTSTPEEAAFGPGEGSKNTDESAGPGDVPSNEGPVLTGDAPVSGDPSDPEEPAGVEEPFELEDAPDGEAAEASDPDALSADTSVSLSVVCSLAEQLCAPYADRIPLLYTEYGYSPAEGRSYNYNNSDNDPAAALLQLTDRIDRKTLTPEELMRLDSIRDTALSGRYALTSDPLLTAERVLLEIELVPLIFPAEAAEDADLLLRLLTETDIYVSESLAVLGIDKRGCTDPAALDRIITYVKGMIDAEKATAVYMNASEKIRKLIAEDRAGDYLMVLDAVYTDHWMKGVSLLYDGLLKIRKNTGKGADQVEHLQRMNDLCCTDLTVEQAESLLTNGISVLKTQKALHEGTGLDGSAAAAERLSCIYETLLWLADVRGPALQWEFFELPTETASWKSTSVLLWVYDQSGGVLRCYHRGPAEELSLLTLLEVGAANVLCSISGTPRENCIPRSSEDPGIMTAAIRAYLLSEDTDAACRDRLMSELYSGLTDRCLYTLVSLLSNGSGLDERGTAARLKKSGIGENDDTLTAVYTASKGAPFEGCCTAMGYLSIMDLVDDRNSDMGSSFSRTAFLKQLLLIGPGTYTLLREYFMRA